jgi:hypothetical protein
MTENPEHALSRDNNYWFECFVIFICPECGEDNSLPIVLPATKSDPDLVSERVRTQTFYCKRCAKQLRNASPITINVYPTTLEDLTRRNVVFSSP